MRAWGEYPDAVLALVDKLPTWAVGAAYAVLWILIATITYALVHRSLARIASLRRTELTEVIAANVPRPAALGVFLAGIAGGLRFVPFQKTSSLELHRVFSFGLAVLGVTVAMRVAFRSIEAYGRSNPELRSSAGIGRAVTWVVGLGLVALFASDALGISLAPALAALGVGSLAVALALQDTLSNFFSGLYIVFERTIRPGDLIRVEPTFEGFVESIGWRSTHLRTFSNNLVVIPNAALSKAIITNYTRPTPQVGASVRVDVAADADVDKVESALADEAKRALDLPGIVQDPAPSVMLVPGFVDGCIAFSIFFQAQTFGDQGRVQHALRKRIASRFRKEGISLSPVKMFAVRKDS
jgi:small-conductance mechanosensitive channel